MHDHEMIAFLGHHKAASTWLTQILVEATRRLGMRSSIVYTPRDFDGDLSTYVRRERPDLLVYANANIGHMEGLPPYRGVHLIRDPRDIIVSGYFSHLKTHPTDEWPELISHRERLRSLDKSEGLLAEIEFSTPFLEDMGTWNYSNPAVHEMRFEEMVRDPYGQVMSAFAFLDLVTDPEGSYGKHLRATARVGLRLSMRRVLGIERSLEKARLPRAEVLDMVYTNRFEAKRDGLKKGVEDRSSHFRRGVPGDWVNHFEPVHKKAFKQRFGDLVVRLGYADHNDW